MGNRKSIGHPGKDYPEALRDGPEGLMGRGNPAIGYDDFWVFDREGRMDMVVPESKKETLNVFDDIERE